MEHTLLGFFPSSQRSWTGLQVEKHLIYGAQRTWATNKNTTKWIFFRCENWWKTGKVQYNFSNDLFIHQSNTNLSYETMPFYSISKWLLHHKNKCDWKLNVWIVWVVAFVPLFRELQIHQTQESLQQTDIL